MDESRKIYMPDGSFHYGLIRTPSEKTFAMLYSAADIDLPPIDINTLPENQNTESWLQIEDQAQQGSCTGNARTSCEELANYRQTNGEVLQLSRQFAYITGQKIDGLSGDVGATIPGSAGASVQYGSCLEQLAPYTGKYYMQFSKEAYADALERRLTRWVRLENYDQCLRWLVWGVGGIQNGLDWNNSCEPDSLGRIQNYQGGFGGGHSLAVVDWNRKFADSMGRPFLTMPNSWSIRWGFKGRAFVSPSVIDNWCKNQTMVGYAKLELKDIKPREYDWLKQSPWS